MVFEGLRKLVGKRDPFDVKGLEQFTPAQQERILGKIGAKEAELVDKKIDMVTQKRLEQLERQSGFGPKGKGVSLKDKLAKIKEFRQGNLSRQAARTKTFEDNEKAFREGKLAVKPVGPQRKDPTKTEKIQVKKINLKAPSKSML